MDELFEGLKQMPVPTHITDISIGVRLKYSREYLGLSVEWVASQMDMTAEEITAFESGAQVPDDLAIAKFAVLYRRTEEYLKIGTEFLSEEQKAAIKFDLLKLSAEDRVKVEEFAEFLASAGKPPRPVEERKTCADCALYPAKGCPHASDNRCDYDACEDFKEKP